MRCTAAALLAFLALGWLAPARAQSSASSSAQYNENTRCDEIDAGAAAPACRLPTTDVDEATARQALGDQAIAIARNGDRLTIFARAAQPVLCCSLQGEMSRIGDTDLWAARYRLAELDRASLFFIPPTWLLEGRDERTGQIVRWRGPDAPPEPPTKQDPQGRRLERTLRSDSLQETRRVYIYLPPGHDPARRYPAIFMADGEDVMKEAGLIESMIDRNLIPPVVLVGAGSGQRGIVEDRSSLAVDIRSADYVPNYRNAGDRFERHLRFFSEELVDYATRAFAVASDRRRRIVAGFSNGGSLALHAALRRPDVFGASIAISPAGPPLSDADVASRGRRAKFYISAGLYEPRAVRRTTGYAAALRARGFDTVFETPVAGHAQDQMELMLTRFAATAFKP